MKLWLVRHAQPLVAPGICYGASDIAADLPATQMAASRLADVLPGDAVVTTSPLQRCEHLTHILRGIRPDLSYKTDARLQEMDFGRWEGQPWNAIARAELDGWTAAFATWRCGGGECVADFMARIGAAWDAARALDQPTVWITHAGVARAATLLAQGRRQIDDARLWPVHAPAFGAWMTLDA
jgi:alpha-ribazole phosphatase